MRRTGRSNEEAEQIYRQLQEAKQRVVANPSGESRAFLVDAASNFPNMTHPAVMDLDHPRVLYRSDAWKPKFNPERQKFARPFEEVTKALGYPIRTSNTANIATEKSYFLYNQLAELEQALVRYTVDRLVNRHGFTLMSVPDLLPCEVIQNCGMDVSGDVTQVFKLEPRLFGQVALSGTAEMALGGFFTNKSLQFTTDKESVKSDGIRRYAAVSRCYRAESTRGQRERGIYRVHHFTKVEMFAVMPGSLDLSSMALDQFLDIQKQLFEGLDLHFKVLDMPPDDLGNPAYRKFDIEALYPGRKGAFKKSNETLDGDFYGEISSCSNCTDYQARRLNIREADTGRFAHTINGTACAVPRMIMALVEQHQSNTSSFEMPVKLSRFMRHSHLNTKPKKERQSFIYIKSPKIAKAKMCTDENQPDSKLEKEMVTDS